MLTFVVILMAHVIGLIAGIIGCLTLLTVLARHLGAEDEWKTFIRKLY